METVLRQLTPEWFLSQAYNEFPEEVRPKVLEALRYLVDYGFIPTGTQYRNAQQSSARESAEIEKMYYDATNYFAKLIDPSFDPENFSARETRTLEYYSKFYKMIRARVCEQIERVLQTLE